MSERASGTDATRLLKPTEVAARVNVTRSTVYRWIESGRLPALRLGGAVRVDPVELEHWIYAPAPRDTA